MRYPLFLLLAALGVVHAQPLSVVSKTMEAPEMGTLRYLELARDGHTFTLVPPRGGDWRMKVDAAAARLQFSVQTNTMSMALRFTTNSAQDVLVSVESLRQHAVPQLGEARKLGEFPVYGGDAAGKAADLDYKILGHPMRCRVAALPVPGGCVDFVLTCGAEEFAAAQQTFGALINTFQRTSRTAAETAASAKTLARRDQTISGQ